jgi:LacI family transcriptional regulator
MNATIYDVASRAGVSISTVSRALNEPHRVQGATLQRIQHAIDDLGFVPKAEATARARRLHRQVGILAPFVTHYPSFTQRMRGIAAALLDTGYELVVYNADTPEHVRGYLHNVPVSRRLDGMILISLVVDDATVERMLAHSFPAVLIEATHASLPGVDIDNVGGGRLAAEYLVSRGHRRIGFVGGDRQLGPYALGTSRLRQWGFTDALAARGLAPVYGDLSSATATSEDGRCQALALLSLPERPTAIFAANDTFALGVLKAAREVGLRVPQDLAIIGFDDADYALYVGLTTISQSLEESGRLAVDLLLTVLNEPQRHTRHIQLPLRVIPRETA